MKRPPIDEAVDQLAHETAGATNANGVNWVDLLDKSTNTQLTQITGFTVTKAGGWVGLAQIRIVNAAGVKIIPFGTMLVELTDFTSAIYYPFAFPVQVRDYKVQFSSTNAGDGAGKTLALNNLDVIKKV